MSRQTRSPAFPFSKESVIPPKRDSSLLWSDLPCIKPERIDPSHRKLPLSLSFLKNISRSLITILKLHQEAFRSVDRSSRPKPCKHLLFSSMFYHLFDAPVKIFAVIWYFQHIQKTGGTSARPQACAFPNYTMSALIQHILTYKFTVIIRSRIQYLRFIIQALEWVNLPQTTW